MDIFGDHAIGSCSNGERHQNRIGKHNSLVECIATTLKGCGIPFKKEEHFDEKIPGDIFIPNWATGRDLWVDLSVVSTLCPSHVKMSAREAGSEAAKRVDEKNKKYAELRNVASFTPVVVETLGYWDKTAIYFFKELAQRNFSNDLMELPKSSLSRLMNNLSVTLQKFNARMLATRCVDLC